MTDTLLFSQTQSFLMALAYTQPRILALFIALPIFNRQLVPGLLRVGIALALGALVAPRLMGEAAAVDLVATQVPMVILKEAFVGFVLGYLIAIPFWAFEAVGFFIDNQRGASVAATLNPLTGNDTSPLGILFNQAFIVFFFVSGGFLLMLGLLYDSFALWPVFDWAPTLHADSVPLWLAQLDRMVRIALVLSAPAIVAMFLAEIGLALISRFVPQLQVFFLAMPIKSAIAILVLMVYMASLFEYGVAYVQDLKGSLPFLNGLWAAPAGAAR